MCGEDSIMPWYSVTISISHLFLTLNRFGMGSRPENVPNCGKVQYRGWELAPKIICRLFWNWGLGDFPVFPKSK